MVAKKKPFGTAIDKRHGARMLPDYIPAARFTVELPSDLELHPVANSAWDDYWEDPISGVTTQSDRALLIRWITNVDRYFRLVEEADKEPIVKGSQGQDVMNPMYQAANNALTAAERLERQLGMGPSNRSRLGIELVAADRAVRPGQPREEAPVQRVKAERVDPRRVVIDADSE